MDKIPSSKKGSFVLYADQKEVIEDLSFEEKGRLLDALFDYAVSGEVPSFDDKSLLVSFKMFKVRIDRDNEKYMEICAKRKESIEKRWGVQKNTNVYKSIQVDTNDTDKEKDKEKDKDKDKGSGVSKDTMGEKNINISTEGVVSRNDPPKKKKKDAVPAEEKELRAKAKSLFMEKYKSMFGEDYYWEGKDGTNLPKLLSKIKFSRSNKNMPTDNDSLLTAFGLFLEHVRKNNFLLNNYTIPTLNSQYNAIMTGQKARYGELPGQVMRGEKREYNEDNFFGR